MGVCPQGLGAIGFIVFFTREYDIFGMLFGKVKALLFRQLIFRDRTQNITGLKKALFRNTIGSLTTMDSGYFWWGGALRRYRWDVKEKTSRSCVYPSCSMVVLLALPSTADDNPGPPKMMENQGNSMDSQFSSAFHFVV